MSWQARSRPSPPKNTPHRRPTAATGTGTGTQGHNRRAA
jgi:hypothetical protein